MRGVLVPHVEYGVLLKLGSEGGGGVVYDDAGVVKVGDASRGGLHTRVGSDATHYHVTYTHIAQQPVNVGRTESAGGQLADHDLVSLRRQLAQNLGLLCVLCVFAGQF